MGKKTKRRPRWRKLSLDDGEERRSPSPGHSEGGGGGGVTSQREKYRPRSRTSFSRSHSVTTYVFDEDEYTKIQTPRQDMIFKKSAFTRRRAPAEGSLSEETETQSVGASSEPAAACPAPEQAEQTATPELSEISSEGKPASECGEGSEPRDPLAALASQIQYAFIDPQGNVYFNVMDESGIIHLPPVAGYYMAPSYPGGPVVATPVPWQAVPIAPLDSPEYQALMRRQQQQQQQAQQQAQPQEPQQTQQQQQQEAVPGQQSGQREQQQQGPQQQTQELADGEGSSATDSRPRSAMSDDAASTPGSRPASPTTPGRLNSSGLEHEYAEPEQQTSPGDEGKTRRVKKKKKKQKKKTNSVDSGVTDEGSDGCRDALLPVDSAAICSSDSSASGGRVRAGHRGERAASDLTSSGVQSDVSLPDSPQRRPSGDRTHVTGPAPADGVSRDGQLLNSAASVLCRQLDSQLTMETAPAAAQDATQVAAQDTRPVTAPVTAQVIAPVHAPAQAHPKAAAHVVAQAHSLQQLGHPKNEPAAVSPLEAAILSQVQPTADVSAPRTDAPAASVANDAASSARDATDATDQPDDASDGADGECVECDSPERELGDDDAESCDSFVYEDKSVDGAAASPPPEERGGSADQSGAGDAASRESSCASLSSEVVPEFEDEPPARPAFTDLSQPVDLRRTVILEETESEQERESSPGSAVSEEAGRPAEKVSAEIKSSEAQLERLQDLKSPAEPAKAVEELVCAAVAAEVCTKRSADLFAVDSGPPGTAVDAVSLEASLPTGVVDMTSLEASLYIDAENKSPVLPGDATAITKEAPKAPSSASNVANAMRESALEKQTSPASGSVSDPAPLVSSLPHLNSPPPDASTPPDGAGRTVGEPSPPSSLSDRSISSAVRGWLKDQSPEAVFVVADDSDGSDDSDLDDDDAAWESDAASEVSPAPVAPPKNVQGNPSPAPRSSVAAGDRVADRVEALAARQRTAAYYSLGVTPDELVSSGDAFQLVDLDERAVLTVPLDGTASARVSSVASDCSSHSEEVDTGVLRAPAPDAPPRASLAHELMQAGSLHRASDRHLIGDSAVFAAAEPATGDDADEGYGGSPLSSPEAKPRARGLPPHPLRHVGAEAPAPWGVCCSLQ